jgi:hypothetical protein
VISRIDGTKRPRRLAPQGIEAMELWLETLRKALERNYDRLDAVLAGMNSSGKKRRKKP